MTFTQPCVQYMKCFCEFKAILQDIHDRILDIKPLKRVFVKQSTDTCIELSLIGSALISIDLVDP